VVALAFPEEGFQPFPAITYLSLLALIVGGLLLDDWLDTKPLFTLIGLVLGLMVAFYGGFKAIMRVTAQNSGKTKGSDEN
jgi:F0F1-type ATP synthase assembly protein I